MDELMEAKGLEVGLYTKGDEAVVYVNQAGVCIFRERVTLLAELAADGQVSVETLRKASARVSIGRRPGDRGA